MAKRTSQKFFVLQLSENDPEWGEGFRYEIQILDVQGRGEFVGYLRANDDVLEIEGHAVPEAVIDAARRQARGQGDYVNSEGKSIPPF